MSTQQNSMNISSEEELAQLRNEGKISEAEYQELLSAMRKPSPSISKEKISETDKAKFKRTLGRIACVFMTVGILLPIQLFIIGKFAFPKEHVNLGILLIPGLILEIFAFTLGIISWRNDYGKAATIVSLLILLLVPFMIYHRPVVVQEKTPLEILKLYALDNMEGVITQSGIMADKEITSDGNGSLRIDNVKPTTIRLFETGDIDIENARLIYQAHLRTENVEGQVYLEMWCHFDGIGDAFSRGLATPLTGSTNWTKEETPFFLKKGENPDNVKLNLVIGGKGTVWIDDIRLLKGPLK